MPTGAPGLTTPASVDALAADLRALLGLGEADLSWALPPHPLASEEDLREIARDLLHEVIGMEVEVG